MTVAVEIWIGIGITREPARLRAGVRRERARRGPRRRCGRRSRRLRSPAAGRACARTRARRSRRERSARGARGGRGRRGIGVGVVAILVGHRLRQRVKDGQRDEQPEEPDERQRPPEPGDERGGDADTDHEEREYPPPAVAKVPRDPARETGHGLVDAREGQIGFVAGYGFVAVSPPRRRAGHPARHRCARSTLAALRGRTDRCPHSGCTGASRAPPRGSR